MNRLKRRYDYTILQGILS